MTRRGFTLIELIIVVAIIAVLAGLAVPYYQDYVRNARLATLRNNVATIRKVLSDFHGDQGRGPIMRPVRRGVNNIIVDFRSNDPASGSELVAGPIQIQGTSPNRRKSLRYLQAMPALEDPTTGERLGWTPIRPTTYFFDPAAPGIPQTNFVFERDFAFADYDGDLTFRVGTDTVIFNLRPTTPADVTGTVVTPAHSLDYTDIRVVGRDGTPY